MADISVNTTDLSLNSNMKFAGYYTAKAGEALTAGDIVSVNSDGEIIKCAYTMKPIGIVALPAADGAPVTVFGSGSHITNFTSVALTVGGPLYISETTAGALTQTKPTSGVEVGIALSADSIMVLL